MILVEALLAVLFVVCVVAVFAGILWLAEQQRQAWLDALHRVARDHGLHVDEGGWLKGPSAGARLGNLNVLVDSYTVSNGKSSSTYTRIRAWGTQPEALTIAPEGLVAWFGKALGASDLQVGDAAFDDGVVLRGERSSRLLSRLDAHARQAIALATSHSARLDGGTWTLVQGGRITDPDRLSGLVGVVLQAARALERTDGSEVEGLWAIVARDPIAAVRVHALDRLMALGADPTALQALLDDPEPGIRLRAGRALSHTHTLRGLLSTEVRREAAVALAGLGVGDEDVLAALVAQLSQPDDDVFEALAAIGTVREVAPLKQVADGHVAIGRVARAATQAIRAIQSRIEGAEAGTLAVAEVGSGALSEAEARDRGRLAQAARRTHEG